MGKDVVFTVKLEPDLRDEFLAEAEATHRPASQLVREFMREFIERQRSAREHDAWFRAQVEQGMREADDQTKPRTPHQEVMDKVEERLKMRIAQAAKRAG
ncbi:antitoxin of toxin-antitoxin stability system [Paraburkholderia sp. CNPSo 3157]|uniref:Antitoxin of toxin-antitoxin stability system n=1 Tax=Paraburkholderia franconis TaxID=2654983 RepID=A0A7X1NKS4_9BURK|nr:antitoxin of toxin-antitoxin stability system [Paraburkholderia franconis]MPW23694.1 antitoxin of toxin-antitoxin stability system [Paraburkholderia franconis]